MKAHNGGRGMSEAAVKLFVLVFHLGRFLPFLPDLLTGTSLGMYFLATCHPSPPTGLRNGLVGVSFYVLMKNEKLRTLVICEWGMLSLKIVTVVQQATGGLLTFWSVPKFSHPVVLNRAASFEFHVSMNQSQKFYPRQFLTTFLND